MSITLYDKAIIKKIRKWMNDEITIVDNNDLSRTLEYKADMTNDKPIELPLIALTRLSPIRIKHTGRNPMSYNGLKIQNDGIKTTELNAIPISINYQIDIFTRYLEEGAEYVRELIFNLVNFPKIEIEIPYHSLNQTQEAIIRLDENIEDNSDIPERLIAGQFNRFTLSFSIPNAYLYNIKTRDNYRMKVDVETKTDNLEKQAENPNNSSLG